MSIHTFESILPVPGVKLPVRAIVVQEGKRVILISPIGFDEEQVHKIRALGEVTDIVEPNLYHHVYLSPAMKLFPKATIWGSPGFKEKRPDVQWKILTKDAWPHADILQMHFLEGAPNFNEVDFFHPATRTLIVMDLCFNMKQPAGWAAPMLKLLGNYDGLAVSRVFKFLTKDKSAMKNSIQKVLQWDFDRIIMGHGEVVESNGKPQLMEVLKKRDLLPNG